MQVLRKINLKKTALVLVSLVFWLAVWEMIARAVDLPFAIPGVLETSRVFLKLLTLASFWKTVALSLLRILAGLFAGVVLAILLAVLAVRISFVDTIVSPAMQCIKSTPVASFILVLWVLVGRATVPIAIALLMVLPIIYQNICEGLRSLDVRQRELLDTFRVKGIRRFTVFILPSLLHYFTPAFITSAGLAWKSGIAAEIIAYTKNSIGREIYDTKNNFDGAGMFAWTLAVILLSFALEKGLKYIGRWVMKHDAEATRDL